MSRPPAPKNPKDDDDSWGKLASDLLGVNLEFDGDLDFPEPEPVAPPPQAVAEPEPVREIAPPEVVEVRDAEPVESVAATTPADPLSDPYWNPLAEWDWEADGATPKKPPRPARSADDSAAEPRSSSREREPRSGGRDRDRGRDERRGPRRDRERDRPQERSFEETPPVTERARSAERPPARAERPKPASTESPPPPRRRLPERPRKPVTDEFGSGIEEEVVAGEQFEDDWADEPVAERPRSEVVERDDFAGDLLDDEEGRSDRALRDEGEPGEDRPRRRRRRRRRGPRSEGAAAPASEARERDDRPFDEDDDEDRAEANDRDVEESTEVRSEEDRPRRRRRRRRPAAEGSAPAADQERPARRSEPRPVDDVAEDLDDEFEEPPRPTVARVAYTDIPTWEEAISYMVKPRSPESRERGEGDRGERRGPRPERRPPRRSRTDEA